VATASQPLKCPQCGAPIAPADDNPLLDCPFCGTRIYLDASHAVLHFIVEPRLDAARAGEALGRWLRSREVVGPLVPSSSELVFFPIWHLTARGTISVIPAAGALFAGLDKIEIPAGDQKIFSHEKVRGARGEAARLVEATVPLEAAISRVGGSDPSARLVHVPLHLVAYSFYGAVYRAAIDACSGQIYPVTAPRSSESVIDRKFAALLAAGLVLNLIALALFRGAPLFSLALLGGISAGLYAVGMNLARWMES